VEQPFAGFARNGILRGSRCRVPMHFRGFVLTTLKTSRIAFNMPVGRCERRRQCPRLVFQSFLDEIALAAGRDPIEFQLGFSAVPCPARAKARAAIRSAPDSCPFAVSVMNASAISVGLRRGAEAHRARLRLLLESPGLCGGA
jgi:hypothetical protein